MTQTYRTDDLAKWGTGKGSNLTPAEVDINFWDVIQRLVTIEALPSAAAGIDHFEISGTSLYVHMTDTTVLGPYTLPFAIFNATGEWAAATPYSVLDTFTINGGLYAVIFAHTSVGSFDAGANDGSGHDYYALMIQTPGSALPTGGAVGQVVQKSTTSDFAVTWGWKLPTGGTARQYLIKTNSTQDNAAWDTPQASDIDFTPSTGSTLISTRVDDALEELSTAVSHAATAVSELTDVSFATGDPASGSMLYFDGSKWVVANTADGDRGSLLYWNGTAWVSVDATTLEAGDLLTFDGAAWVRIAQANVAVATLSLTGDLTPAQRRGDSAAVAVLGSSGTVSLDPTLGDVFIVTPTNNITLNAASGPTAADITIIVTTSGTSSFNITFGTNFKSQGVLATGTVTGKTFAIKFTGNSSSLIETGRTTAM